MRLIFLATLLTALCSLPFSGTAHAHKVNIFAYVEGDIIYTESYFPDGRPVENGIIEVIDPSGKKLLEGKTDTEGTCSFRLPAQDDLTIVINASMGHKSKFLLKKSDL